MALRQTIIAGNWKMNCTGAEAKALAAAISEGVKGQTDLPAIVLCPPFTNLETVGGVIDFNSVTLGAQNMDHRDSGAFTGEVSPPMLLELKVKYILIGHSERRQFFGETNQTVNLKLKAALQHKLIPIVCVGETPDERESNLTDSVVSRQVVAALQGLPPEELAPLVIAYEPVWAIGTGKVCEAMEANRVIRTIRQALANTTSQELANKVPILYGGSVNSKNVDEQLIQSDIDGSLVGGASLKPDEFLSIIASAKKSRLKVAK
jgi:triosephosphate isomerase